MLKENILWYRAINPVNGRPVKEPTFLGMVLLGILFIVGIAVILFLASFL